MTEKTSWTPEPMPAAGFLPKHRGLAAVCLLAVLLAPSPALQAESKSPRIEVKDGWFYVDGEKTFIKGVCFFENHMVEKSFGRSSLEVIDHEFARIKQAGFNAVRSQLTAPEIELAGRHGLLVMQAANHLFFSHEYLDPKVIAAESNTTRDVAQYTRTCSNVLYYIVDNEPQLAEGIYRQGEPAFYAFQRRLIGEVKAADPTARVSLASYPPAAFLDYSIYDVISLNAYPICPAKDSIGYGGYLRWFKKSLAPEKPLIVSEYGWEIREGEAGLPEAMTTALDQQIQAGAAGSFFYTWRAFGPEGEGDNRWYGVVPNQGRSGDYRQPARSLLDRLHAYFEAVVIKPSPLEIYSRTIPFEVCGTEATGAMEAWVHGARLALHAHGKFWWNGELPVEPAWPGEVQVKIIARDREGKILSQKQFQVHLPPSQGLRVRLLSHGQSFGAGDSCQVVVRVEDGSGKAKPDMPVRIGINQTADPWGSRLVTGRTDARGEYELVWGPLTAGHATLMATVDQAAQDLIEPGVMVLPVNKNAR